MPNDGIVALNRAVLHGDAERYLYELAGSRLTHDDTEEAREKEVVQSSQQLIQTPTPSARRVSHW